MRFSSPSTILQMRLVSRLTLLLLLCGVTALVSADRAGAAAVVHDPNCLAQVLPPNDDGSTAIRPIGFQINFFGTNYQNLYVNNNGNFTFNGPLATFTPFGLSGAATPIIAAFFADVDTRGAGSGVVTYGNTTFEGHPAFCANWTGVTFDGVGYFAGHADKLNTFQILLVNRNDTGADNFDIVYNYDKIQWETGDASGGHGGLGGSPARVGYSNGTQAGSYEEPGSGQSGAFLDSNPNGLIFRSRNSATAGRLVFPVRNGQVTRRNQFQWRGTAPATVGPNTSFSAITNCDANSSTRPLIVEFGTQRFTKANAVPATSVNCDAPFTTQTGSANGQINGAPGTIEWTVFDGGVSSQDRVSFTIRNAAGQIVSQVNNQPPGTFNGAPGYVIAG
jgi:hypothetical protein